MTLLDIWPGYQKLINEPDSWTKYTPAERKLKYWAGYQLALQKYPQFKAVSQEQFLNDPYAAMQNVDRFIQKPTANGIPDPTVEPLNTKATNAYAPVLPKQPVTAADAIASTGTVPTGDWLVKPWTDKGQTWAIGKDGKVQVMGPDGKFTPYVSPGSTPYEPSNPELGGNKPRDVIGYDANGQPLYAGQENLKKYDTLDEYNRSKTPDNRDRGAVIGYTEDGTPLYAGDEAKVVYPTIAARDAAIAARDRTDENRGDTRTNAEVGGDVSGYGAASSLSDASWMYGTGADFAKYGNFPYAEPDQGGRTWKPGVILGQEGQNRYLAGDQFKQWLPGAFQQAIAATPQAVPTPTWKSYSQGLTGPGMWAAGYPQNIQVGGNAAQTGQTQTQNLTQGQQFNPYNMTAPYGFSQQQYNPTQYQTPWYQGLGGTQGGTTPASAGADQTQGTQTAGAGLAGTGGTTPTGGVTLAANKQKADPNAPPATSWPLSNRSQMYTAQGVNNQQAGLPQTYAGAFSNVGNQALGGNQSGQDTITQLRNLANPNQYNAPTNTYGSGALRGTSQTYAQMGNVGAAGRAQGTEGAVGAAIGGQLNQNVAQNPLYQQAQSQLSSQLGAPNLANQINTAISGNLDPQMSNVYNKQLQDTLYADQTRRLDEDYAKQLKDTQDYYNFYGLSGSSAENEQTKLMTQALQRKKEDIGNTLNAQMIQKAQGLQGAQLGNLTNALSGVSSAQNQGINSAMGLMDLPAAQQRAAAGLGLGLLGQQQTGANDEYSRLMASLNEATGAQGQAANISLGAAGQNLANTGQQAGILGNLSQLGMQGYGAGSDTSQWLTNYFDQLSQTQRANAAQDYTMASQESAAQQQAQQQNYQNLLQNLGIGTGLYDTFGTQGWNQMRTTATDLANMATGWNQQAATNQAGNNWWQPLLGGVASTLGSAAGAPRTNNYY